MMRQIIVSNESTTVSDAQAQAAVAAVQTQIDRDFAPAYSGLRADLVLWPKSKGAPARGAEIVHILDQTDQADALGYHELNGQGYPEGFVFAKTSQEAGDPWSTTLSHEVLEQILDPFANWMTGAQMGKETVWVTLEDCDAVEQDSYVIAGVQVSNFVLPSWFSGAVGKVDFLGRLKQGLTLDAGGYIAYVDASGNWQQITGRQSKTAEGAPKFSRKGRYVLHAHHAARGVVHTKSLGVSGWLQILTTVLQVAPGVIQQVQGIIQIISASLPATAQPTAPLTPAKP